MPSSKYLGNDVFLIHGFWMSYGAKSTPDTKRDHKETAATVKQLPARNMIAITADYYQTHAHKTLRANGFRAVFSFPSAHNDANEFLTFWVRRDADAPKQSADQQLETPPGNCSVSFNREHPNRLAISTKRRKGYTKIAHMPIWYKIAKKYVIKPDDLT